MPKLTTVVEGEGNMINASSNIECPDVVTDVDGNTYPTVVIGEQCWMQTNLATEHYRDGSPIENISTIDKARFGMLYRFSSVEHASKLCPVGWKVPSDKDFMTLELAVGMSADLVEQTGWRGTDNESRKLKRYDRAFFWSDEEKQRVNTSGFSILPAGAHSPWEGVSANGAERYADFWTSTAFDQQTVWYRSVMWTSINSVLRGDTEKVRRKAVDKGWGFSVRCLKE